MKALRFVACVAALISFPLAHAVAAAESQPKLAVLEFEVAADFRTSDKSGLDRVYFSDKVRGEVGRRAPDMFVMTRESIVAIVEASGRDLSDCEGACEVNTGRQLGADYVVSGRITKVGARMALTMRLFATADGRLLGSEEVVTDSVDVMVTNAGAAVARLVRPTLAALSLKKCLAARSNVPAIAGWTALGAGALGGLSLGTAWLVKRDIVGRPAGDSGVGGRISTGETLNLAGLIGLGVAVVGLSTYALVPAAPSCGDTAQ